MLNHNISAFHMVFYYSIMMVLYNMVIEHL